MPNFFSKAKVVCKLAPLCDAILIMITITTLSKSEAKFHSIVQKS